MTLWSFSIFLISLLGMGAVAFVTLLERKVLGLTQIRLGPNKVTFEGILQPLADGIKLLSKQNLRNKASQATIFALSPVLLLGVFVTMWVWFIPWLGHVFDNKHSLLLFFSLLGVSAYTVIFTGWSSTSVFSKLGSVRGILQSLSYEVALILLFLCLLVSINTFNVSVLLLTPEVLIAWLGMWLIMALMETNRAPFDLLEGESELISGFNIEMGSLMFVYLFLSEYGMLIIMAAMTDYVLMNSISIFSVFFVTIFLLLRSCFPRFKYDSLMTLMWQILLPVTGVMAYLSFF